MSKRSRGRGGQLVLVGESTPAVQQETPQQRAAKGRAITFSMTKHEENPPAKCIPPTTYGGYSGASYRNQQREQWPLSRPKAYFDECIKKYNVTFPMRVTNPNGAVVEILRPVEFTEAERAGWIFANDAPCLLKAHTILAHGTSNVLSYDFSELFEPQGDM